MFLGKAVLKICSKFTGEHPCQSAISIKLLCLRNGTIPHCRKVIVDGRPEVPICILGDPAYPLIPYLMKEFASGGKDQREKIFGIAYRLREW